ncbi:MFS transporter [Saccharopolyspora sp. 5N708]|uniref:MFS transporter n=1 Tax=Saccharopolyspora sp. 5N708 TaxID=3457424 RepID=UPI003FD315B7
MPQATTVVAERGADSRRARKAVIAGGIGNFIEWYDYGVYAALSPVLSKLFFPAADPVTSTLASFAVFGVGFVIRPLGGLFFGQLGDRRGRRTALGLALIMVSLSTFAMGVLPTYSQIGLFAPLLMVVLRLVQGFSAGGEWTGSATLMVENAANGRRGWVASWQQFSVIVGQLAGILIVTVITNAWSEQVLRDWAWRLPFLIALVLGAVGFYIRFRMEDTPHFRELQKQDIVAVAPTRESLRTQRRAMATAFLFVALPNVGFYTFLTYMPTFLNQEGGLALSDAYAINLVGMAIYAVLTPVVGKLSDRFGRRPMLIAHAIGFLVLAYPIYLLLAQGSFALALGMQLPALLLMSLYAGPGTAAITEMFPTRLRYSSLALPYNLSSALFGGTAPFVSTWLIATFHSPLAPAFYTMLVAVPTLVVYLRLRETAHEPLREA